MRQKSGPAKATGGTGREGHPSGDASAFSGRREIRIVLEGLRGEESIAELCRREGIVQNLYYRWSKEFLEAGKKTAGRRYGAGRDVGRSQRPAA